MAPDLVAVPAAAALNLAGCLAYSVHTLRGKVHPNGVTWLLWSVAPLIAFAAELSQGVGITAVTTLSVGLGPLLVFGSALARKGTLRRPSRGDLACGTMSLLALAAWWRTSQPEAAVALSIAADALATIPTLVKAYRDPLSEDSWVYSCVAAGSLLTLITVPQWSFTSAGFPGYLLLVCGTLGFLTRPRPTPPIAVPAARRSRGPWLIAGAAGLLGVFGVSAMLIAGPSGDRSAEAGRAPKAVPTLNAAHAGPSGGRLSTAKASGRQTPLVMLTRMGAVLSLPKQPRLHPGTGSGRPAPHAPARTGSPTQAPTVPTTPPSSAPPTTPSSAPPTAPPSSAPPTAPATSAPASPTASSTPSPTLSATPTAISG